MKYYNHFSFIILLCLGFLLFNSNQCLMAMKVSEKVRRFVVATKTKEQHVMQYAGFVKHKKAHGRGKWSYVSDYYDGYWKDGCWDGRGCLSIGHGRRVYDGHWKQGKFNGKGTMSTSNGRGGVAFAEGVWKDNQLISEGRVADLPIIEYFLYRDALNTARPQLDASEQIVQLRKSLMPYDKLVIYDGRWGKHSFDGGDITVVEAIPGIGQKGVRVKRATVEKVDKAGDEAGNYAIISQPHKVWTQEELRTLVTEVALFRDGKWPSSLTVRP